MLPVRPGARTTPAARDRLPARRPRLRGPALPAAPGPRRRPPPPRGRRPAPATPEGAAAKFEEDGLGFARLDVKRPPELRTADGERRERFPFVATDRRSRSVHLTVEDEETEAAAEAFFPFRVTRLPTDRGGRLTAEGFGKRRREPGVEHRETRPCTPRTNGTAERFDSRVQREVLGVTVAGTATWSGCSRASTRPATPAASASRTGARRRRSSGGARRRTGASPIPATARRPTRASCPGPCW